VTRPPLFLDLDGPLLDVRARYHAVYTQIARELGVAPLPLDAYWQAKRQRAPLESFFPGLELDQQLTLMQASPPGSAGLRPASACRPEAGAPRGAALRDDQWLQRSYLHRWLTWIEAPDWLAYDQLVPGALQCLNTLSKQYSLYLVTLRRNQEGLQCQLEATGLRPYFTAIFSGWCHRDPAGLKASWMRPLSQDSRTAIVGDSEVDMEAARCLGMRAIGVSFGIREPEELQRLGAERVVDDLKELTMLLR